MSIDAALPLPRPEDGRFTVRLYDETGVPPQADVVAVYVLYSPRPAETATRLENAWARLSLRSELLTRKPEFYAWGHRAKFERVVAAIEDVQGKFPP